MTRTLLPIVSSVALVAVACTPARSAPLPGAEAEVGRVLDDWHDAAARADEERYFAHIADGGVFLGTDMTERWDKAAFRAYAHPHFAKGKAWAFRAVERHVRFGEDGSVAWFDERLETPNLGPARGAGVLARAADGGWKVVLYDLSVPIPNDKFSKVKALIAQ